MAISRAALTTAFLNMNFQFAPSALEQALINSYADQTALAGVLSDEQALLNVTQLVGDTTAVAALTYQFFTGSIPGQAGFFYLVNSEGNGDLNPNVNDLNDPYYATFNQENRYYNFALNLSTAASGAAFRATYTNLSIADTVTLAYETIIGSANAIASGRNPTAAIADINSRADGIRAQIVQRLGVADDAAHAAQIALAWRAGIVAYILNEGFKASVGNYADALELFLLDIADNGLADDSTDGNGFGGDLLAEYPGVDDAREFTLTAGADAGTAFTGGSGDDTFFATQATLGSTDNLDGGAGDDTLVFASSGNAPVSIAGFDTSSIEEFQITSDALGGTTLDVSGAEDLERIVNTNSSRSLTLNGMVPTIAVTIENTTQNPFGGAVNTNIQYIAAATAGDNTAQQITLTNVIDPVDVDGQTTINLGGNADGVEIVNLVVGGSNILNGLESNGLDEVNVTGGGDLTMNSVGFDAAANVFNATNATGVLDITFNTSGFNDVVATGGSGNDRFDYQAGFDVGDSLNGGAGSDLLVLNADTGIEQAFNDNGDAANTARGTASNTETATLASGTFDSTINLANLGSALTTFNINTNTNSFALVNLLSTTTIVIDDDQADLNGDTLTVDFLGDSTTDLLNLTINNTGNAGGVTNLILQDDSGPFGIGDDDSINTFNLVANGNSANGTGLVLTMFDLQDMASWNIAGSSSVFALSGAAGLTALLTVNGSTSTGDINLNNLFFGASVLNGQGISITTGSGADQIGNAAGSTAATTLIGNDTIVTGAGNDLVYSGTGNDTITLGSGNDEAHGQQGNDVIDGGTGNDLIWGNFGADTLTGGTGADVFNYVDVADSQGATSDLITDFVSGTDVINLSVALTNAGIVDPSLIFFRGNAPNLASAITAFTGSGAVEAVFDVGSQSLLIDVNGDGQVDGTVDMTIRVNAGPNGLVAADLQALGLAVTFTAAVVGFNTGLANTSQEGTTTANGVNDVINTTFARLNGATVNGGNLEPNFDILNITDAITVATVIDDGGTGGNISNVERLNLRGGSTAQVTGPTVLGSGVTVINFGQSTIYLTGDNGQTVNGSNQSDTVTVNQTSGTINAQGGNDVVNVTSITSGFTLDGGTGGLDALNLANNAGVAGTSSIANFENINFIVGASTNTFSADVNEYLRNPPAGVSVNNLDATDTFILTGGGSARGLAAVGNYSVGGISTFFLGSSTQNVTGPGGTQTFIDDGFDSLTGTYTSGGADSFTLDRGTNQVNVTGATFLGGFVNLNLTGETDVLLDDADGVQFSNIVGGAGTNVVTLNDTAATTASLGLVNGVETIVSSGLTLGDLTTFNTNSGVTVTLGGNNVTVNAVGAGTNGSVVVNAAGGNTINTNAAADTVTISGNAGLTETVNLGGGNDTLNYTDRTNLVSTDLLNGGSGTDTFNVGAPSGGINVINFNGVTNFEVINTFAGDITSVNGLIAAGANLDYNVTGNLASAINFNAETNGSVDVTMGTGGGTIDTTSNVLSDTYTLNLGATAGTLIDFTTGSGNTLLNFTTVDTIINFNPVIDSIDTGVAGGTVYTVTLGAGTTQANFAGGINTFIANNGIVAMAGDVYVVEVGGGTLAGTYLVQDFTGNGIDNSDFAVEAVNIVGGSVTPADFV